MKSVTIILVTISVLTLIGYGGFEVYNMGYSGGEEIGYDSGYLVGQEVGYNSGQQEGYHEGQADGYSEGYLSGEQDGYSEGYLSGEQVGYSKGYLSGEQVGYDEGYLSGEQVGYDEGYLSGEQVGYDEGYLSGEQVGYDAGVEAGLGHGYTLRDPTYAEALAFLSQDKTDENEYNEDSYVCSHFARDVGNNAEQEGLRCALVELRYSDQGHTIIAFDTIDSGLVYFEPQSDERAHPAIGLRYYQTVVPEPGYYYDPPDYDDTILDILVIW